MFWCLNRHVAKSAPWGACVCWRQGGLPPEFSRNRHLVRCASTQADFLSIIVAIQGWLYVGMNKSVCLKPLPFPTVGSSYEFSAFSLPVEIDGGGFGVYTL